MIVITILIPKDKKKRLIDSLKKSIRVVDTWVKSNITLNISRRSANVLLLENLYSYIKRFGAIPNSRTIDLNRVNNELVLTTLTGYHHSRDNKGYLVYEEVYYDFVFKENLENHKMFIEFKKQGCD